MADTSRLRRNNRKKNDTNGKVSNIKKDGFRKTTSIKSIIDKKLKGGYNANWRVRDLNNNIIGYIKKYCKDGFIIRIDKNISCNEKKIITIINHPYIKESFKVSLEIKWKHNCTEFLDEVGTLIIDNNKELDKLFNYLKMFYPNMIDNINQI